MTQGSHQPETRKHIARHRPLIQERTFRIEQMDMSQPSSRVQLTLCIHSAPDIHADPVLAASLTDFVNKGYRYITSANKERWNPSPDERLSSHDSIHKALSKDGLFAVVYIEKTQEPVACAATTKWEADLEGFAEDGEMGWEIKMVTTQIDWMKKGLAGQCVDALIDELARQEKMKRVKDTAASQGPLNIWIQAVECLNGPFWLKKGGRLIRSYNKPIGHWGSKYGYRLLVLLREVDIDERLRELGQSDECSKESVTDIPCGRDAHR